MGLLPSIQQRATAAARKQRTFPPAVANASIRPKGGIVEVPRPTNGALSRASL